MKLLIVICLFTLTGCAAAGSMLKGMGDGLSGASRSTECTEMNRVGTSTTYECR